MVWDKQFNGRNNQHDDKDYSDSRHQYDDDFRRTTNNNNNNNNNCSAQQCRPRATTRRPHATTTTTVETNSNNNTRYHYYPPPVYHRHYKQPQLQSNKPVTASCRVVLLFPILLFGTILTVAFWNQTDSNNRIPYSRFSSFSSNGAMSDMLYASRLRLAHQQQSQQQQQSMMMVLPNHHDQHAEPTLSTPFAVPDSHSSKQEEEEEQTAIQQATPYKTADSAKHELQTIRKANTQTDPLETDKRPPEDKTVEAFSDTVESSAFATSFSRSVVIDLEGAVESSSDKVLTLHLQQEILFDNNAPYTTTLREFPISKSSRSTGSWSCDKLPPPSLFLPIDNFPKDDPFLPWIHDYWYVAPSSSSGSDYDDKNTMARIQFVAQNKRRCQTGVGKTDIMKHWEPQMALFQSIPLNLVDNNKTLQLARDNNIETATVPETRLVCHFHSSASDEHHGHDESKSFLTFSQFSFNYEYVLWRKRGDHYSGMFVEKGKDTEKFELSQLMFYCPVPPAVLTTTTTTTDGNVQWFVDLIPIRTKIRRGGLELLLTQHHVGPEHVKGISDKPPVLNDNITVPIKELVQKAGRWANLPICLNDGNNFNQMSEDRDTDEKKSLDVPLVSSTKRHTLVVCTWTANNYFRRGDVTAITDSERRLREWVEFHRLVGVDHIYIYDNTPLNATNADGNLPLKALVETYLLPDFVTYIPWPCQVCSNNRPNHPNPGERSSQYAAEASCRERFGPATEWMAFIDQDEYLVPMMPLKGTKERTLTWRPILEQKRKQGYHVLKMRSSRGRPRLSLMETIFNDTENVCVATDKPKIPREPCVRPPASQTFLRVYNCEYIRPPKPERFQRAMKQIYQPDFVKSHYVHYSTITKPMTEYYYERRRQHRPESNAKQYTRDIQEWEWGDVFLDDLDEGCLVHTKSIVPHETMYRSHVCRNDSKIACPVGIECPDSTPFVDKDHQKNIFHDENGNFCNCWINHHLEDTLIPRLEEALGLRRDVTS